MKLCIRITTVVLGVAAWLSLTHGASGGSLTFTRVVQDRGRRSRSRRDIERPRRSLDLEWTGRVHRVPQRSPREQFRDLRGERGGRPLTLIADVGTNFRVRRINSSTFRRDDLQTALSHFRAGFTATVGDRASSQLIVGAGPLTTVVNGNTPIPGGSGNFA